MSLVVVLVRLLEPTVGQICCYAEDLHTNFRILLQCVKPSARNVLLAQQDRCVLYITKFSKLLLRSRPRLCVCMYGCVCVLTAF